MKVEWAYLGAGGEPAGASPVFEDRESAEEWMGRSWKKLLEEGIVRVELQEDGRSVYRMGLEEA